MIPESNIQPEFNEYFKSLKTTNSDNPWLSEFLQKDCGTRCDSESRLRESVNNDMSSSETLVMDGVYAFAHALDGLNRYLCPDGKICPEMRSFDGEEFRQLLNTSFTSVDDRTVTILPNGDVSGRYSIRYFKQLDDGGFKFVTVGQWDKTTNKSTVIQDFPWSRGDDKVEGICREPCDVGQREKIDADNTCCWTCSPCDNDEIVVNNNKECRSCIDKDKMIFAWPNENSTECVPLVPGGNSWIRITPVISGLGLIVAVVTIVLYSHNHENALIKASGRELSYLILIGELLLLTKVLGV